MVGPKRVKIDMVIGVRWKVKGVRGDIFVVVIPAKAGIHSHGVWIPVFTGMTLSVTYKL
jgi:hypothetical protein